jgi:hypothetical protein
VTGGSLPEGFDIGPMRVDELPVLGDWAEAEGWNPGRSDLAVAWGCHPEAFIALRFHGELVGAGSILPYGDTFGFMGLFIVRPDFRSRGLGRAMWFARRDLLISRLRAGSTLSMDGVVHMVPFYAKGGFVRAWDDVRFEGIAGGEADGAAVDLRQLNRSDVHRYEAAFLPAPRERFLDAWLDAPGVIAAGLHERDGLVGFGCLRPAAVGYRFGPVHADSPALAARLLSHLQSRVVGSTVQLDVPEVNASALQLAGALGLAPTFVCARMFLGAIPEMSMQRTYGATSLEFG